MTAVLRNDKKVQLMEDLELSQSMAQRKLLAAQSLQELVTISGNLYEIPSVMGKE